MRHRRLRSSWILASAVSVLLGTALVAGSAPASAAGPSARPGVATADDPAPEPARVEPAAEPEPEPLLPLPPIIPAPPKATPETPKVGPKPQAKPSKVKTTSKKNKTNKNKKKGSTRGVTAVETDATVTPVVLREGSSDPAPEAQPMPNASSSEPRKATTNPDAQRAASLGLPQAALRNAQSVTAQAAARGLPLWVPAAIFGLLGMLVLPVVMRRRRADIRNW